MRAATGVSWRLAAALCAAGCGQPPGSAAPRDDAAVGAKVVDDGPVWITTGRDSLDLVRRVLGRAPTTRSLPEHPERVAALVPRGALPAISEAQHTEHHRCGGFVLHDSEQDAMSAASGPRAIDKQAPSYTVDNAATVEVLLASVREDEVLATARKLASFRSRFHTSPTSAEAVTWLSTRWRELAGGRADITVEEVEHTGTPQHSVKMTMRGASASDEVVVIGGHLDSVGDWYEAGATPEAQATLAALPAPGADDNAAGIAVLTELLRVAVEVDYRPERTVVFYAYAAEEIGLVGSRQIARQAMRQNENVIGVMQLDMVNFNVASEPYIAFVRNGTDEALNAFAIALIEAYVHMPYRYRECVYACSDYASWAELGYPTTFPNEAVGDDRNPHVHSAEDTLAWSNDGVVHAMHFVKLGAAFMAELGKGQLGPSARADEIDSGVDPPSSAVGRDGSSRAHDEGCSLRSSRAADAAWGGLVAALLLVRRRRAASVGAHGPARTIRK